MGFTVTVTMNAAHSGLLTTPLNTGRFRGEFNIVQGNCIGHCDHVSNFEWLPRQGCLNVQTQIIVKINYLLLIFILIYFLNDVFVRKK